MPLTYARPVMNSSYRTQSRDTSYEAERFQIDRLRCLTLPERLALLDSLIRLTDRLSRAGILMRYPEAGEREIGLRSASLRLDPELMRAAYGWDPDEKGL